MQHRQPRLISADLATLPRRSSPVISANLATPAAPQARAPAPPRRAPIHSQTACEDVCRAHAAPAPSFSGAVGRRRVLLPPPARAAYSASASAPPPRCGGGESSAHIARIISSCAAGVATSEPAVGVSPAEARARAGSTARVRPTKVLATSFGSAGQSTCRGERARVRPRGGVPMHSSALLPPPPHEGGGEGGRGEGRSTAPRASARARGSREGPAARPREGPRGSERVLTLCEPQDLQRVLENLQLGQRRHAARQQLQQQRVCVLREARHVPHSSRLGRRRRGGGRLPRRRRRGVRRDCDELEDVQQQQGPQVVGADGGREGGEPLHQLERGELQRRRLGGRAVRVPATRRAGRDREPRLWTRLGRVVDVSWAWPGDDLRASPRGSPAEGHPPPRTGRAPAGASSGTGKARTVARQIACVRFGQRVEAHSVLNEPRSVRSPAARLRVQLVQRVEHRVQHL